MTNKTSTKGKVIYIKDKTDHWKAIEIRYYELQGKPFPSDIKASNPDYWLALPPKPKPTKGD